MLKTVEDMKKKGKFTKDDLAKLGLGGDDMAEAGGFTSPVFKPMSQT